MDISLAPVVCTLCVWANVWWLVSTIIISYRIVARLWKLLCSAFSSLSPPSLWHPHPFFFRKPVHFLHIPNPSCRWQQPCKARGQQMCFPSSSLIDSNPKTQPGGGRAGMEPGKLALLGAAALCSRGLAGCILRPSPFSHLSPWPHPPHCAASQPDRAAGASSLLILFWDSDVHSFLRIPQVAQTEWLPVSPKSPGIWPQTKFAWGQCCASPRPRLAARGERLN